MPEDDSLTSAETCSLKYSVNTNNKQSKRVAVDQSIVSKHNGGDR
jgi:hypothetical protein